MENIKKVLLLTAIGVLSFIALACSPDELEQENEQTNQTEECNCTKYYFSSNQVTVIDVETNYVQENCESEGSYPDNILSYENEVGVTIWYVITCE